MAAPDAIPPTGVIGLGEIGRGVAGALQRAGVALTVCDVRPEATEPFRDGATDATVAASPAGLAAASEVVLVAVVDDDQVRAVVTGPGGVLAGSRSGTVVLILSTVATTTVAEVAAEAAGHGVAVLDCGVSGGPGAAAEGQLVCMVGGPAGAVERARPVLDVVGSLVLHMGPLGAGLSAKLARNLVQYGSWLAAYEAQVLAEAAGVPLPLLARAIRESDRRIGGAATLMFRETAQPLQPDARADAGLVGPMTAAAGLARKDLGAALALADTLGVDLPLARMARDRGDRVFGLPSDDGAGTSGKAPLAGGDRDQGATWPAAHGKPA